MNITLQRTRPVDQTFSPAELLLARKLEAAATGSFPHTFPKLLYLTQAQALFENPDLAGSVVASLAEIAE